MTKQLHIFDTPAPFQMSETSQAAAKSFTKRSLSEMRKAVLAALDGVDLTADEIAEKLGLAIWTVRPRVTELKVRGFIKPSGKRRPSSNGHPSTVWRRV